MARKHCDPEAPEVLESILQRMREMTREEWLQELAWCPEKAEETRRTQHRPELDVAELVETPSRETAPR